jgi:coproporphyrinogen III oxidase-like Fe-S oxidoreductase
MGFASGDVLTPGRDVVAGDPPGASAVERLIRSSLLRLLTGEREIRLTRAVPTSGELREKFKQIDALGLYLHIPFCEQICPYCPYNRELYSSDLAERYVRAVAREIDIYADIVGDRPVTSFYIGGGTPTTLLQGGLAEIIGHVRQTFDLQCEIHMESHPNHLSAGNLRAIESLGVRHLSIGVESLVDRHLKTLCRPYTAIQVKEAVGRAVSQGFTCVNVDVMFALPGQTYREIEETGRELVKLGVGQVAAYPLFLFPYTPMGRACGTRGHVIRQSLKRRRMMSILERIFYRAGYERTSVWAFTRRGVPRYCSVTVPLYLGLGASGGSYLRDVFYLNTFGVAEYCRALEDGRMAIALSVGLSERMQRAGWLYWRIYETRFRRADYRERFGEDLDAAYGGYLRPARWLGLLTDDGERIALSDSGAFWLHACEDLLSIDYVSKLWGLSRRDLWPERAVLS